MNLERERTPEELYDDLLTKCQYEYVEFDKDKAKALMQETLARYDSLKANKDSSDHKAVFSSYYGILKEFCDIMLLMKEQKTDDDYARFLSVYVSFPELDLDFQFFEKLLSLQNKPMTKELWKSLELQFTVYTSAIVDWLKKNI